MYCCARDLGVASIRKFDADLNKLNDSVWNLSNSSGDGMG